jgi:hypothetical protein
MGQTYDITMTEDQRATLLIVLDSADTAGGIKGARRQARAATALESFKLKNPVAVTDGDVRIPPKSPVIVRLTHENVEVIVESIERGCKPTIVQGQEVKPSVLTVRGMKIIDSIVETLELVSKGGAAELEDVEVLGLNGTGGREVPAADEE